MPRKTLPHAERIARRKKIAAEVRKLLRMRPPTAVEDALADVSDKFGVSLGLVREACREHNVALPRKTSTRVGQTRNSTLQIIAKLMAGPAESSGRNESEIAREHKLSRERVRQIKEKAIEAGVLKPKLRKPQ